MARTFGVNLRASRDTNQAMVEEPTYMCGFSTIVGNWEARWGVIDFPCALSVRYMHGKSITPSSPAPTCPKSTHAPPICWGSSLGPPAPAPVFYPERPHGFRPRHAQRLRPD